MEAEKSRNRPTKAKPQGGGNVAKLEGSGAQSSAAPKKGRPKKPKVSKGGTQGIDNVKKEKPAKSKGPSKRADKNIKDHPKVVLRRLPSDLADQAALERGVCALAAKLGLLGTPFPPPPPPPTATTPGGEEIAVAIVRFTAIVPPESQVKVMYFAPGKMSRRRGAVPGVAYLTCTSPAAATLVVNSLPAETALLLRHFRSDSFAAAAASAAPKSPPIDGGDKNMIMSGKEAFPALPNPNDGDAGVANPLIHPPPAPPRSGDEPSAAGAMPPAAVAAAAGLETEPYAEEEAIQASLAVYGTTFATAQPEPKKSPGGGGQGKNRKGGGGAKKNGEVELTFGADPDYQAFVARLEAPSFKLPSAEAQLDSKEKEAAAAAAAKEAAAGATSTGTSSTSASGGATPSGSGKGAGESSPASALVAAMVKANKQQLLQKQQQQLQKQQQLRQQQLKQQQQQLQQQKLKQQQQQQRKVGGGGGGSGSKPGSAQQPPPPPQQKKMALQQNAVASVAGGANRRQQPPPQQQSRKPKEKDAPGPKPLVKSQLGQVKMLQRAEMPAGGAPVVGGKGAGSFNPAQPGTGGGQSASSQNTGGGGNKKSRGGGGGGVRNKKPSSGGGGGGGA